MKRLKLLWFDAACGVTVMITELDVGVFPLTNVGQIIGQSMGHMS
ncbi:MAG TPA: hypothetical protein VFT06_05000 [Flavisolibacter sp.]|nr:hypothetical protein [Flavisolibacter sp.]